MPAGFTKSFAERLNSMSRLHVFVAVEGGLDNEGHADMSMGVKHLILLVKGKVLVIHYLYEQTSECVKH